MSLLVHHLKDHIVPSSRNNYVPHVIHHRALLGYSAIMVLLKSFAVIVSVSLPSYSVYSSAVTPENIISLTNETRSSLRLPVLGIDERLMQAAQAKANDMFTNQYFAHTSPDGTTPWYWFQTYGYTYRSAGENLAAHFTQAEDVSSAWMASPSHRDNIVSDRYNEIGVGIAQGTYEGYETTFVVQMFGYEQTQNSLTITADSDPEVNTPDIETQDSPSATTESTLSLTNVSPSPTDTQKTFPDSKNALQSAQKTAPEPPSIPALDLLPAPSIAIDNTSLILTPIPDGYTISVSINNAVQTALNLANQHVPLTYNSAANTWSGTLTYAPETVPDDGQKLYLVATSKDNQQQIFELATILPTDVVDVFATAPTQPEPKLFGILTVGGMRDGVHATYLTIMALISLTLIIAIIVKFNLQKPHVIAHSLFVITLALGLLLI
jgi:hypothetical protein